MKPVSDTKGLEWKPDAFKMREACASWCETNGFPEAAHGLRGLSIAMSQAPEAAALSQLRTQVEGLEAAQADVSFVFGEMFAELQTCRSILMVYINSFVKHDDPQEAKDAFLDRMRALDHVITDAHRVFDKVKAVSPSPSLQDDRERAAREEERERCALAMEPFADLAETVATWPDDDAVRITAVLAPGSIEITLGDLRRVRSTYAAIRQERGE